MTIVKAEVDECEDRGTEKGECVVERALGVRSGYGYYGLAVLDGNNQ